MTLPGARKRLHDNKGQTVDNLDVVERLKAIRAELVAMRDALDSFTYSQVEELKKEEAELSEYESYIHSQEYIEDTAKKKLGLVYGNEIIFREE